MIKTVLFCRFACVVGDKSSISKKEIRCRHTHNHFSKFTFGARLCAKPSLSSKCPFPGPMHISLNYSPNLVSNSASHVWMKKLGHLHDSVMDDNLMHSKNYWPANLISRQEHFDFCLNTTFIQHKTSWLLQGCLHKETWTFVLHPQLRIHQFQGKKVWNLNVVLFPRKKMFGVKLKIACIL